MQTEQPVLKIGEFFNYGGNKVEVEKIEITRDGVIYNNAYVEGKIGLKKISENEIRIAYAYERLRDGKIEKYTREWGGNQYTRRVPQFDEFSDRKTRNQ